MNKPTTAEICPKCHDVARTRCDCTPTTAEIRKWFEGKFHTHEQAMRYALVLLDRLEAETAFNNRSTGRELELGDDRDRWKSRHELNMKNENLRIKELEADKKHWIDQATIHSKTCLELETTIKQVREYVQHKPDCNKLAVERTYDAHCDCGLQALIGDKE